MIGTLQEFKDYVGEASDKADPRMLSALTRSASLLASSYNRRAFESAPYDLLLDGSCSPRLQLPDIPVTAVSAVYEAGTALVVGLDPNADPTPDVIWYGERGSLVRIGAIFSGYPKHYRVVYTAGYSAELMPEVVKQAAFDIAALIVKEKDRIGTQSKTAGQQTTQYLRELPEHVRLAMEQYRMKRRVA